MRLLLVVLVSCLPSVAIAAPSDDIKSLIDQGKAADAYQLGTQAAPLPSDELFDYYVGVAAGVLLEEPESIRVLTGQ